MLSAIVDIQLQSLVSRLRSRQIEMRVTEAAKLHLATEGWDPAFGARPLKRTIQQRIENPLAMKILSGEVGDGQTVTADFDGARFTFQTC
jgi:ATP-dependent Clp protease ATP-binding subunit ClpB